MGYTKTCSHTLISLPFSPTPLQPFLTQFHLFCALSHPLSLMFSSLLLVLNPLPPMHSLSHQFPIRIQIFSHNPTHCLPFQPIFSPYILRAYILYVPMFLCAFVFLVFMCACNSFLYILLPISIYFTCLCVC